MRPVKARVYEDKAWVLVDAMFHGWGLDFVESRDGIASYSVGILEKANGQVVVTQPHEITFTDK